MARITTAGTSNWRAAFEEHPGLAVTAENYERLLAAAAPAPAPEAPEVPAPAPVPPRRPPARQPAPAAAAEGDGM